MSETMISNEVEEMTSGINVESIEEAVEQMEQESEMESAEPVDFAMQTNSVITNEYFEKKISEMKDMNYIEIVKLNREMKNQKDILEKAKESVEQIIQLEKEIDASSQTDDNLASAIAKADVESSHNLNDINEFLSSYDDTMDKLMKLIKKSEEIIKAFDDIPKTTSYMNKSMLQIVNKNLDKVNSINSPSMKNARIYYQNFQDILLHQTSVDFILEKLAGKQNEIRRLKTSLKKDRTGGVMKSTQKNVTSLFCTTFSVKQLDIFEKYLKDLFGDDEVAFYFQYALSCIYRHEKNFSKHAKHKWVEILIMNILDIHFGKYDLEGGKEAYNAELMKINDTMRTLLNKK